MKNSIKLLATVSAILSANVFAAETAPDTEQSKSHVLKFSVFNEHLHKMSHMQGSDYPGASLAMKPTSKWHDEITHNVFERIGKVFSESVRSVIPNAKLTRFELDEFHLFSDTNLMKYEPGKFEATKESIVKNIKPFTADLSNVMLCVRYTDKDGEKKVLFLPNTDDQASSLDSLRARKIDARPIAQLKEFVPEVDFEGRRIVDSTLVISLETGGLIETMLNNLSAAISKDELGPIVRAESDNPLIDSLPVVTMKKESFISPTNAEVIERALNVASDQLLGKDSKDPSIDSRSGGLRRVIDGRVEKLNIDFKELRLSVGINYNVFSGEFR